MINPGVTIGDGAVVASGAVVTDDAALRVEFEYAGYRIAVDGEIRDVTQLSN